MQILILYGLNFFHFTALIFSLFQFFHQTQDFLLLFFTFFQFFLNLLGLTRATQFNFIQLCIFVFGFRDFSNLHFFNFFQIIWSGIFIHHLVFLLLVRWTYSSQQFVMDVILKLYLHYLYFYLYFQIYIFSIFFKFIVFFILFFYFFNLFLILGFLLPHF